jgi:hypothetical protein
MKKTGQIVVQNTDFALYKENNLIIISGLASRRDYLDSLDSGFFACCNFRFSGLRFLACRDFTVFGLRFFTGCGFVVFAPAFFFVCDFTVVVFRFFTGCGFGFVVFGFGFLTGVLDLGRPRIATLRSFAGTRWCNIKACVMSSAGMTGRTISCPWISARPSRFRLRLFFMGVGGTFSDSLTSSVPAGMRRPFKMNPFGASFKASVISPENPSFRRAYMVMGTDEPARTLILEGTTRSSKSGRGGLIRSRYP